MRRWVERKGPGGLRGFSLLELVIVIVLVVFLYLVAADRLFPLRGTAEGTQVASVIGSLRSALGLEVAGRIADGGPGAVAGLQGMNPMDLLQQRPDRYIGTRELDPADVDAGAWYFHPDRQTLIYRVRFPQYLEGEPDGPVALRWQVRVSYDDRDGNSGFDPEADRLRGVRLVPLDDHAWPEVPRAGLAETVTPSTARSD